MTTSKIRQESVHTRGSDIDDSLDPPDHDANATDLADSVDYFCSQLTKITGEPEWETAPVKTIKELAAASVAVEFDIFVASSNFAKDVNVPGVTLDLTTFDGDMGTPASPGSPNLFLVLNGRILRGGTSSVGDWYPGDSPASGDVKFRAAKGIKSNDLILTIAFS
jgi:hypothetical protein